MNPHYPDDCQNPDFDPMNSLANSGLQPATKPAHTPTPLTMHRAYFHGHDSFMVCGTVGDSSPFLFRLTDDTPNLEAVVSEIVRAVNSHAELVAALQSLLADAYDQGMSDGDASIDRAKAALAKAQT